MTRGAICLVGVLLACAAQAGYASEPAPNTPAQDAAINLLKQKLGSGFTVHRVGVLVVAWDLDAEAGAAYEAFIQSVQDALYKDLLSKRPSGVFKVALFKDTASLQKNAKKLAVKSPVMPMGGFYMAYERVICADVSGGRWLVQHEITHALLHADLGRENWPSDKVTPWIDEGFASLFENAPIKEGAFEIGADWRLAMACRAVEAGKLPGLRTVMTMDFATYNSMQNRFLCDVVARNFLLFLHERQQLAGFYKAYRAGVAADPSGIKALEKTMQNTVGEVEAEWLAWVRAKGELLKPGARAPGK